jgi:flagellar biosynthesis protein FlhF
MRLKTYTAPDMQAALRLIRDELGQQALILNTRKIKNAKGEPTLEITAALNEPDTLTSGPTTNIPAPMEGPVPASILPAYSSAAPAPAALPKTVPAFMQNAKVVHSQPAATPTQMPLDLQASLETILRGHKLPVDLIERLTAAVKGLTAAQFSPADALEMVLGKTLSLKPAADLLPATHAHAFAGPHGAGKTSFIIRLAQQWKNSGAQLVVLSLDNLKLGGFDPLEKAAEIFHIPVKLLTEPKDLSALGRQLGPSLRILIDTPGLAPADRIGQQKLRQRLDDLNLPLQTHLLLPAAWHGEQLPLLPAAYQSLKADSLIAARLDEALTLGPLVATLAGTKMPTGLATNNPQLTVPVQQLSARWIAEMLTQLPRQPWELGQ